MCVPEFGTRANTSKRRCTRHRLFGFYAGTGQVSDGPPVGLGASREAPLQAASEAQADRPVSRTGFSYVCTRRQAKERCESRLRVAALRTWGAAVGCTDRLFYMSLL